MSNNSGEILSIVTKNQHPAVKDGMIGFALQFQQMLILYDGAVKEIITKLEILKAEFHAKGMHEPIDTIKSRIKQPVSIAKKLEKNGMEISLDSMQNNLNDIAGIRIICPYISDIYTVRDILLSQPDISLIKEKDYIKNPKPNGYRSLHLVIEVDVSLSECTHRVKAEIQLRTIAMDSWATLEHQLRYKSSGVVSDEISEKLYNCAELMANADLQMEEIANELNAFDQRHINLDVSKFM